MNAFDGAVVPVAVEILDGMVMVDAPEERLDDAYDCLDDLSLVDADVSSSSRLMPRTCFTVLRKNRRKRFGSMQCS